jgi:flagellar basal body-associated protein FliL
MAENSAKASQGKASKKVQMIPIIIGVVLLIVGLLVGKTVLGGTKKAADKKAKAEVGISLPLDEFLVNLTGGGDHYLRTTIALGLKKRSD